MKISHSTQKAVSPVIGVILMVAITIVLAAVVYVWVTKYSLGERTPTGVFSFTQQTVNGGTTHYSGMVYIFENKKVRLSDIQVLVNTKIDGEDRSGKGDLDGFSGTTGIVSEWHFNSGTGNIAYDSSGNENDGTIHGAAWISGMSGSALSFNGSNDYVNVPYAANLDITGAITIELWMNPTNFHSGWNYLVFQTNYKFEFGFYSSAVSEEPRFKPENSAGKTFEVEGDAINTGQWDHVVGVRDGSFVGIYVNGILKKSRNDFTGDLKSGGNVQIGGEGDNNGLNSTIDEVRIYNGSLTSGEIAVHAGGLAVFFQDAEGDGMLSSTDVFTVRGADPGDKISLIYKPTGGLIASHIF
jgi:flagellin-like protein